MTKEQHDILAEYEQSFREARSGYYRAILMSDAQKINQIWEDLGHEKAQLTCGRCVLVLLQKMGEEFFNYKEETIEAPKANEKKQNKKTIKTNKK